LPENVMLFRWCSNLQLFQVTYMQGDFEETFYYNHDDDAQVFYSKRR
jgi:hypothetical protein